MSGACLNIVKSVGKERPLLG